MLSEMIGTVLYRILDSVGFSASLQCLLGGAATLYTAHQLGMARGSYFRPSAADVFVHLPGCCGKPQNVVFHVGMFGV